MTDEPESYAVLVFEIVPVAKERAVRRARRWLQGIARRAWGLRRSERALVPEKITGWLALLLFGLFFLIWLSIQLGRTIGVP